MTAYATYNENDLQDVCVELLNATSHSFDSAPPRPMSMWWEMFLTQDQLINRLLYRTCNLYGLHLWRVAWRN